MCAPVRINGTNCACTSTSMHVRMPIVQVAQESSQLLTEVCGTPDYFAPELAMLAQGQVCQRA